MFEIRDFESHGGIRLKWKIECDTLTDDDITALASIIADEMAFEDVYGIPTGGERLATALKEYTTPGIGVTLVVDDVMTTGKSMKENMAMFERAIGVVIFSRCKELIKDVYPMFNLGVFK